MFCDPMVGPVWSDIQFKGAVDVMIANGLTSKGLMANVVFDDLVIAEGTSAVSKGVLRRALARATPCTSAAAGAQVHFP